MNHKLSDPFYLLIFFALGGGAVAGVGMAGAQHLRGRKMTALVVLSYIAVGTVAGVVHLFVAPLIGIGYESPEAVFRGALVTGIITLLTITGRDIGFRMTINRFGWKGKVELFRPGDDGDEETRL